MDILRWILIVAGIGILALLYFQGRAGQGRTGMGRTAGRAGSGLQSAGPQVGGRGSALRDRDHDAAINSMSRTGRHDPLFDAPADDPLDDFGHFDDVYDDVDNGHFDRYADAERDRYPGGRAAADDPDTRQRLHDPAAHAPAAHGGDQAMSGRGDSRFDARPIDDLHGGESRPDDPWAARDTADNAARDGVGPIAPRGRRGLAARIEAISARLSPGRTERLRQSRSAQAGNEAGNDADKPGSYGSKIVTLHVVAPDGQIIDGMSLAQAFEARGYEFGDMDIFHSRYDGKTLFSIVKGVEPGSFDCSDVASFDTPGVSLVLQLPGPVPADVAFEVLLTEARELADMLGCSALDAERSTLSRQSLQHMRESINDYMHRQKYFQGVPS